MKKKHHVKEEMHHEPKKKGGIEAIKAKVASVTKKPHKSK